MSHAAEGPHTKRAQLGNKTESTGACVLRPAKTREEKSGPWASLLKPRRWKRHMDDTHSECWLPHTRGLQSLTNLAQVVVECFQLESTINHWGREGVNIKSRRRSEELEDFHLSLTEVHYSFLSPYSAVLALRGPNLLNAIYPKPRK